MSGLISSRDNKKELMCDFIYEGLLVHTGYMGGWSAKNSWCLVCVYEWESVFGCFKGKKGVKAAKEVTKERKLLLN